jgi:magnesium-transporting ATPase (P-type)
MYIYFIFIPMYMCIEYLRIFDMNADLGMVEYIFSDKTGIY